MAAGDVERLREAYRLLHKGDPRDMLAYVSDDAVWEPARQSQRQLAEGGQEVAKRLLWRGAVHRLKITDAIDLGPHVLLTLSGRRMQFMGAGFFARSIYQLVTVRDGRIVRLRDFRSREEAMTAAKSW